MREIVRSGVRARLVVAVLLACGGAGSLGCEEIPADAGSGGAGGAGAAGASGGGGAGAGTGTETGEEDPFAGGKVVDVEVPASGRVHVDLDTESVVEAGAEWDLAFDGQDVFTNGGVSGGGEGAAFGPFVPAAFLGDEVPEHPFLIEDEAGGAFLDWFAYDGATHSLYSRFHVYGVRRGEDVFKVQVLGFYGEVAGAPVSAVYSMRVARVTKAGVEATVVIEGVDATAGGVAGTEADPSGCVVLATGETLALTPEEAAKSEAWDLCFRRAGVSVNGGIGGPGGVEAVDLDREATEGETLEGVMKLTAASELGRFDAVTGVELSDAALPWHGDRIVSAFSDHWIEAGSSPIAPAKATWLVAAADGVTPFFVAFESFTGATEDHPGTVRVRVKKIGGGL